MSGQTVWQPTATTARGIDRMGENETRSNSEEAVSALELGRGRPATHPPALNARSAVAKTNARIAFLVGFWVYIVGS